MRTGVFGEFQSIGLIGLGLAGLACATSCFGQKQADFAWATQLVSSGNGDRARALAVDHKGNVFVTGEFNGTIEVGAEKISTRGGSDMFLAKFSPRGQLLWLRQGGGSGIDRGYGVAADAEGDCIVSGHFQSKDFRIGDAMLSAVGDYDAFLAKFSPEGKLIWVHSAGGEKANQGFHVTTDRGGNCYWTGSVSDTAHFGATQVTCRQADYFVAKYAADGTLLWVRAAGGEGSDGGRGVAVDSAGNVLVVGFLIGQAEIEGQIVGAKGARDVFVAKYGAEGRLIWVRDLGGRSDGRGESIGTDPKGNVYITGMFTGTAVFGRQTLRSVGRDDVFLAKYDPAGKALWAVRGGGPGEDNSLDLAVRPGGEVIITGDFTAEPEFAGIKLPNQGRSNAFVVAFGPSGTLRWIRTIGGPKTDVCYAIGLDSAGNIFVAPTFAGQTAFGRHLLTTPGGMNVVVGKLSGIDRSAERKDGP